MSFFIGDTPIIKIFYKYKGETKYLYSKLEFYNLTGSIKDRVALYMIKKAEERGDLKPGMPIIEATSGNTGIALSALGNVFRHKVYIFMPDWVSRERVAIMKNFGAKIILVSKEYGGFKRCFRYRHIRFPGSQWSDYRNHQTRQQRQTLAHSQRQ